MQQRSSSGLYSLTAGMTLALFGLAGSGWIGEAQAAPITTATVNVAYNSSAAAVDPDGGTVTYLLLTAPAGMTIDAAGQLAWTPTAGQAPTQAVVVKATDPSGASATLAFVIAVQTPPAIASSATASVQQGSALSHQVVAYDLNGGPLTYSLPVNPSGLAINAAGLITGTPASSTSATVRVTDAVTLSADQPLTITVTAPPAGTPFISSTPITTATERVPYVYQVVASDPNSPPDSITYSLALAQPALGTGGVAMAINASTGRITWTPGGNASNTAGRNVAVRVTSGGQSIDQFFTITVINVP